MKLPEIHNPIRAVAVACVAIISVYVMYVGYWLIQILSSPEWCGKALQAERISSQNFGGLTACVDLLKIQLKSLATNSYMLFAVIALCLLTLMVIVIAGGRLQFSASKTGISGNMSSAEDHAAAAAAAVQTAGAAVTEAGKIATQTKPVEPSPRPV